MCKWVKRFILAGVLIVGVGYLTFGTSMGSYAKTAFGDLRGKIKKAVPVDFELRRAHGLIREIDPEINSARRDVARAEVELENLEEEIRNLKTAIIRGRGKIGRQRKYLAQLPRLDGDSTLTINVSEAGVQLTTKGPLAQRVRRELARAFDLYKNQKELLRSKLTLVSRQRRVLEAARSKLNSVRSERAKLEDLISSLEAKKKQLDAMAAAAKRFDLDTSALGEARKVLAGIRKRLDVTKKIIEEEMFLVTGTPSEEEGPQRDILGEVDRYFGNNKEKSSKVLQAESLGEK
jgi:DNA repair exonuclease SbcCD ATPase subunit